MGLSLYSMRYSLLGRVEYREKRCSLMDRGMALDFQDGIYSARGKEARPLANIAGGRNCSYVLGYKDYSFFSRYSRRSRL